MKNRKQLLAFGLITSMSLAFSACDKDEPMAAKDISLRETSLGKVLTDDKGMTLYYFTKDVAGASLCSGGCLTNWPIFAYEGTLEVGDGLNASDFTTITRADGTKQTAYKGWPLYYFHDDKAAGDVKGENVNSVWVVAKPAYTIMLANQQLVGNDGKSYKSDYTEGTGETQFFVDGQGRTLYTFIKDKKDMNKYTKEDFSNDANWPIFTAEIEDLPSALDKSLFNVITVFNKKQLTYKGWPIYYFGADNKVRGATKGVSVPQPGVWPVVQKGVAPAPI